MCPREEEDHERGRLTVRILLKNKNEILNCLLFSKEDENEGQDRKEVSSPKARRFTRSSRRKEEVGVSVAASPRPKSILQTKKRKNREKKKVTFAFPIKEEQETSPGNYDHFLMRKN